MYGKNAPNKIVNVPVGTSVYHLGSADPSRPAVSGPAIESVQSDGLGNSVESAIRNLKWSNDPIADLIRDREEFVLCKGGAGGKGNVHFKSSRNRAPREYTDGDEGESGHFLLELRAIADAALVGYPNAGKSTLIQRISAARSKIAPYPFTTLHPVIGVVELGEYRRATVADIPGLIEGAHRNLGLGHDFLRHITRCRLLLFVVDIAGSEGRSPIADLESLRREIDLYDPQLSLRPWVIVANKMDLPQSEQNLRDFEARFPQRTVLPISARENRGISDLKRFLGEWIQREQQAIADPTAVGAGHH